MNECFYVFRIIISCVFVYLDSIKVSHSFYDAKIAITSIAYIRLSSKCCILLCNVFTNSMQTFVIGSDVHQRKYRTNK